MRVKPIFKLSFEQPTPSQTRDKIKSLASDYLRENNGAAKDKNALGAGAALRSGVDIPNNLRVIHDWKLESFQYLNPSALLEKNSKEEMADAVRLVTQANTPRAAVAILIGLSGIGIPTASAILTVMYPDRNTVIDKRALKSLGHSANPNTIEFYLQYLAACNNLAVLYNVDLRTLDRALWQVSDRATSSN
jgi:hypothetical protein